MSRVRRKYSEEAMPPRSRLYSLRPMGLDTAEVESLTSYVNRLAWTYRVGPQFLAKQEIVPHLRTAQERFASLGHFPTFCRYVAMLLNSGEDLAADWVETLERLTLRSDLHHLTICQWAKGLPRLGLMRDTPAWCSKCYACWREQKLPLYQPLRWMLQAVTVCPHHHQRLEDRCPSCQKVQSAIAARAKLGNCTQCGYWLGTSGKAIVLERINNETLTQQQWVMSNLEELRQAGIASGGVRWDRLPQRISVCAEAVGSAAQLSRLVNIRRDRISLWRLGKCMPSLGSLLDLCSVLGISLLELVHNDPDKLKETIQTREWYGPARQPRSYRRMDTELARELIQAVLDGREAPLAPREVERRLDLPSGTLTVRFPQECALMTLQYQAYRAEQAKKRVEKEKDEIRQATLSLHAQGISPNEEHMRAVISHPSLMARPANRAIWRAVRHELGIK